MASSAVRETGVVVAVKDAYGFIRCAEREDKLFFHFSSLVNASPDHEIDRGDEVSFAIRSDPESGRLSAVQVLILPPGTVVFEEVADTVSRGVIERELQLPAGATPTTEPFGGRVKARAVDVPGVHNPSNDEYVLLEFSGRDVDDGQYSASSQLAVGDVVDFKLFTEKRSGRQGATSIRCVQPGGGGNGVVAGGVPRETGVVISVKDSYGFIRCFDRDHKQMFFHFSELVNPSVGVHPGAEVEFNVGTNKKGQLHATRLVVLEPGTLKANEVEQTTRRGVVSQGVMVAKGPAAVKARRSISTDVGVVDFLANDDDEKAQSAPISRVSSPLGNVARALSFTGTDLADPRFDILPGDEVEFRISTNGRTRRPSATSVVLVTPAPLGRERGVINVLKNQYGFIKCEKRPDPLFFHFSEVIDQTHTVAIGDEVEFNVLVGNDQVSASRLVILPRSTVKFNTTDLRGVVTAEPGSRSSQPVWGRSDTNAASPSSGTPNDVVMGAIQLLPESVAKAGSAASTDTFAFGPHDLLVQSTSVRVGDEVEFAFSLAAPTSANASRLSLVRLVPKKGVVDGVYGTGGTIRLVGGPTEETVGWLAKDVSNGVTLHVGDEVLINNLTLNIRRGQRVARLIERTKEAPVSDEGPDGKQDTQLTMQPRTSMSNPNRVRQITRMAQGPDGTRGFKPGSRPLRDGVVAST